MTDPTPAPAELVELPEPHLYDWCGLLATAEECKCENRMDARPLYTEQQVKQVIAASLAPQGRVEVTDAMVERAIAVILSATDRRGDFYLTHDLVRRALTAALTKDTEK